MVVVPAHVELVTFYMIS